MLLYMLPISLGHDVFELFECALAQQNEITGTEEPSVFVTQPTLGRSHPALRSERNQAHEAKSRIWPFCLNI